jgi:hypothetical protein
MLKFMTNTLPLAIILIALLAVRSKADQGTLRGVYDDREQRLSVDARFTKNVFSHDFIDGDSTVSEDNAAAAVAGAVEMSYAVPSAVYLKDANEDEDGEYDDDIEDDDEEDDGDDDGDDDDDGDGDFFDDDEDENE